MHNLPSEAWRILIRWICLDDVLSLLHWFWGWVYKSMKPITLIHVRASLTWKKFSFKRHRLNNRLHLCNIMHNQPSEAYILFTYYCERGCINIKKSFIISNYCWFSGAWELLMGVMLLMLTESTLGRHRELFSSSLQAQVFEYGLGLSWWIKAL